MKKTVEMLAAMKQRGEKIVMVTAYDCPSARLAGRADIDIILVGDSLGMVVMGYKDTRRVTMVDMLHHVGAVARAEPDCLVVGDMPHLSYENADQAVTNARMLIDEAGADVVKIEGDHPGIVQAILGASIPVMGHIGLTPQTTEMKVQGKDEESASRLVEEAGELERAGCFSLVLEGIPRRLAKEMTAGLGIPTIGIGAGPDCDGQVLISHDMLGLYEEFTPKFVKRYADIGAATERAFAQYRDEVKRGVFPTDRHSYH